MADWFCQHGSARRRLWAGAGLLALITMLVYLPALRAGFIWDDDLLLTDNPLIRSPDGWWRVWWTTETSFYFPVTWTAFWAQWHLWGMNPAGYHVVNVLCHALGAVLLWRVLARLEVPGAWLAALLFAVHPVNVESVAWISEQKNTLAFGFAAAATLAYLDFERTGKRSRYALALGWFALALLSKSTVVMLPVAFWLCAWWQRGRVTRRDLVRTAPLLGLALAAGLASLWFQNQAHGIGGTGIERAAPGPLTGLLAAGWTWWFYLLKALWPANLMTVYPLPSIDAASPMWYAPAAGVPAIFAALWWQRRRAWARAAGFGLAVFSVMLFPIWGLALALVWRVPVLADHLQHTALVGIVALAAAGLTRLQQLRPPLLRRVCRIGTACLVAGLGGLCWQQSGIYQNQDTLWQDALRKNTRAARAHFLYGTYLLEQRRLAEAVAEFEQTIQLRPRHALARLNLGNLHAARGAYAAALEQFQQAAAIQPDWPELHDNLGNALVALDRFDDAVAAFAAAISRQPTARRHYNLGLLLRQHGRTDDAVRHFQQALQLDPSHADARFSLGTVRAQAGDLKAAVVEFSAALRARPDFAAAHFNLGLALLQQRRLAAALPHLREAARLNPHDPAARQLLAEAERLPR